MLADQLSESSSLFGTVEFQPTPSRIGSVARGAALTSYWQSARDVVLGAHQPCRGQLGMGRQLAGSDPSGDVVDDHLDECGHVTGETDRFFVPDGAAKKSSSIFAGYAGSICQARHAGNIKVAIPDSAVPGTP
jgi:hypothetical protein